MNFEKYGVYFVCFPICWTTSKQHFRFSDRSWFLDDSGNLHICSNHNTIHDVFAEARVVHEFLQFSQILIVRDNGFLQRSQNVFEVVLSLAWADRETWTDIWYTHVYIYTSTNIQIYIYTYIHIYKYTYIHIYTFTQIYKYTNIHIYMQIHICANRRAVAWPPPVSMCKRQKHGNFFSRLLSSDCLFFLLLFILPTSWCLGDDV